jgi:hypothetical protein
MGDVYYSDTFTPFVSLSDTATTANRVYANPVLVPGSMTANTILVEAYNADSSAHTLYYAIYQETSPQVIEQVMSDSITISRGARIGYIDITAQTLTAGQYYVLFVADSAQLQLKMASIGVDAGTMKTPWWQYQQANSTLSGIYSWMPPVYSGSVPWCALVHKY